MNLGGNQPEDQNRRQVDVPHHGSAEELMIVSLENKKTG